MTSTKKQTNYHFKYSVLVNNTPQKVWEYLIDVSRWKEWDTELLDSEILEEFSLGAKGTLTPKKGPKLNFIISELNPITSYTFVTTMPLGKLVIKRTLKKREHQIEFTDDIRFTGVMKRLFGLVLGRGFKLVLPTVMRNFKEFAEKE